MSFPGTPALRTGQRPPAWPWPQHSVSRAPSSWAFTFQGPGRFWMPPPTPVLTPTLQASPNQMVDQPLSPSGIQYTGIWTRAQPFSVPGDLWLTCPDLGQLEGRRSQRASGSQCNQSVSGGCSQDPWLRGKGQETKSSSLRVRSCRGQPGGLYMVLMVRGGVTCRSQERLLGVGTGTASAQLPVTASPYCSFTGRNRAHALVSSQPR